MGEREMNVRMGNGCGTNNRTMNRGMSRPYYNTRTGSTCGCTGKTNGAGNHHQHAGYGMNTVGTDHVNHMHEREGASANEKKLCCDLIEKLRKLEFGIVDVALYLNAYPESDCALAYYHKLLEERSCLLEKINEECGPMTLYDNQSKTCWKWAEGPWPWHLDSN